MNRLPCSTCEWHESEGDEPQHIRRCWLSFNGAESKPVPLTPERIAVGCGEHSGRGRDAALDRMLDTVVPEMLAMIRRLAEPAEPTERERKLGKLILWDCKCGQTNVFPNGNGPVKCVECGGGIHDHDAQFNKAEPARPVGVEVGMPPGVAPIDLDRAHPFCRIGDCKFNSGAGSRCSLEPETPREPNHGACAGYAVLRPVGLNTR